jgi:hypothetical protein
MNRKIKHPQQVADMVKKHDEEIRDTVFDQAIEVFGKDTLFIHDCIKQIMREHFHDCIKQIMREHFLDYRSANLQAAFIKVAIGVKKMNYPKALKNGVRKN